MAVCLFVVDNDYAKTTIHSFVANYDVVEVYVQVRAEGPMEHRAQGKRSGTLGLRVLESSRPVRAKALQCALGFYQIAIKYNLDFSLLQNATFASTTACVLSYSSNLAI